MKTVSKKLYSIFYYEKTQNPTKWDKKIGKAVKYFIIGLILVGCISIMLETFDFLRFAEYKVKDGDSTKTMTGWGLDKCFIFIERFSLLLFSIEYCLRLIANSANPNLKSKSKIGKVLKYATSKMAIIDLIAILPGLLSSALPGASEFRVLRIFRLFRLLKITNHTQADEIFYDVIKDRKTELTLAFSISLTLMLLSSLFVFFVEHHNGTKGFDNILSGLRWAVATLTPGPGAYEFPKPSTSLGIMGAVFTQMVGIAIIALPTGIIGGSFAEALKKKTKKETEFEKIIGKLDIIEEKITKLENKKSK